MTQIYTKMAKNILIQEFSQTLYQKLAKQFDVSTSLVGKIVRGERIPKHPKSKGMKVKKAIDKLREENKLD